MSLKAARDSGTHYFWRSFQLPSLCLEACCTACLAQWKGHHAILGLCAARDVHADLEINAWDHAFLQSHARGYPLERPAAPCGLFGGGRPPALGWPTPGPFWLQPEWAEVSLKRIFFWDPHSSARTTLAGNDSSNWRLQFSCVTHERKRDSELDRVN